MKKQLPALKTPVHQMTALAFLVWLVPEATASIVGWLEKLHAPPRRKVDS